MKNIWFKSALVILAATLTGCSGGMMPGMSGSSQYATTQPTKEKGLVGTSVDQTGKETNVSVTMTGGGDIGLKSMDADDKTKMSRALDAATGKSTHWQNGATGIDYTVTPIRKIVVQGNPFCREYSVMVAKGSYNKQINGRACVTTDGSWHTI